MKKIITIVLTSVMFGIGFAPAYAESNNGKGSEQKVQKTEVQATAKLTKNQIKATRSLQKGVSGDDVKELQSLLAQNKEIYPEALVTGYYGLLTEQAVKRFQKKYGIEQVGVVGPKTRAKLEEALKDFEKKVSEILDESENDDDDRKGSSAWASTTSSHKLTLCHKGTRISVDIHAIAAHLNHGDTVTGICTGTATTTDKTAPTISGVSVAPSVTTATVNWSTNESADSRVWYATSSPVILASSKATAYNASLLTGHSVGLSGLSTSTTYYYLVVSRDASGNSATSTEGSFTTHAAPAADTTPPLIFSVFATPSVNSASVSWMTNEPAQARVWYATTLDVMNNSSKATAFDPTMTTSRSVGFTGLTANTQYYFLLVSADASGNTATSTSNLYTFTTSPLSLSSVTAVPASTTATVTWQTNIGTDSTVHYATSTPVLTSPTHTSSSSASLVTNHALDLSTLVPSTTYYYLVVSKDAFGNSATSSESSFTTLAL